MPIPTTYLDFDPETMVAPPALGSTLTLPFEMLDGTQWTTGGTACTYGEISGHKVVSGDQVFRTPDSAALPALTYYAVFATTTPTQMGQNMAALYVNIGQDTEDTTKLVVYSGDTADSNAAATRPWASGDRVVVAWTFTPTESRFFVNGVLDHVIVPASEYMGATTPTVLPMGDVFRAFIVPSVQTDAEIQALSQELLGQYVYTSKTITWDAPAHDGGSSVLGYVVRVLDGSGAVTEQSFDLDDPRTFDAVYAPPATAQVLARNAQGLSQAVEVSLT